MLTREGRDRTLPTFITFIVVGILLMTFDVRLQGGGVVAAMRSGTQAIVAPLQKTTSFIVNPVADMVESLASVASVREQNRVLAAELAEARAELVAVQDRLARLEQLEALYGLRLDELELGRTAANVIGKPDPFDAAFVIDRGISHGVVVGQPVIDTNGNVVGTVTHATAGTATVVPITAGREGLTVMVGAQVGTLVSQVNTLEMRLDILDAREPVLDGDQIYTSAVSSIFPAGLPVGEVIVPATPENTTLTTFVRPFVDPDALRIVVVLAWPPDPLAAVGDEVVTGEESGTGEEDETADESDPGDG